MMIQLIICTIIYLIFFLIKNNENSFSKQTVENVSNILSYDINFKKLYNSCEEYLKNQKYFKINNNSGNNIDDNSSENGGDNSGGNSSDNNNGVGGGDIPQEQIPETNKSQMEIDSEYIKQSYNLIIPVSGNITSGFGNREPTEIISAFHQGVDIGAVIRNSNLRIYGRKCNCCFVCWRLWKSY